METFQSFGTHFIEYADGTFAEYFKKKINFDDDGNKKYIIWLKPGRDIISMFDLKVGEQLNQYGIVEKSYNFEDVHICRDDPTFGRIWIETDYDGNPTTFSMRNDQFKETIKNLRKENNTLKAMVASAHEELKKVMTSKKEWMRGAVGIIDEALKVRKNIRTEGEELEQP